MNRSDNKIKTCQDIFRIVQATVYQDITFNTAENPERSQLCIQQLNFPLLLGDFFNVQSSGIKSRSAMVCDSQVFIAQRLAVYGHFPQGMLAIAISRMVMKASSKVVHLQQNRELTFLGHFYFKLPFP